MVTYEWKCTWGDVDPAGIAYYPRLTIAMNRAGEEFMDARGLPYWEAPDRYGVHFPVVAMDMEFESPVRVGDVVSIAVEPELGTKSFGLHCVGSHGDGSVAFRGNERHVCADSEENRSLEIPPEIRETIAGTTE